MKYILFLICILSFNYSVFADPGSGITVNFSKSKLDPFQSGSNFTDLNDPDRFSMTTISDPFSLKAPPTISYGRDASGTFRIGNFVCSAQNPEVCKSYPSCRNAGGFWMILDNTCERVNCHIGTIGEINNPTKCNCLADAGFSVERGNFLQSCPSQCSLAQNKVFSFATKGCICTEGYTMNSQGICNPAAAPAPAPPEVSSCWRELVEKVASCESASTSAVSKCDPGEDDSLRAIQGLLTNTRGGAKETCDQIATASTSGFYQVENTRKTCDEQLSTCRTSCDEAKNYLMANKERLYNACRERAFQEQVSAGPPLPQDRFNPMWDGQNRASLEAEFQGLIRRTDSPKATCETGDAVKNREKLSTGMAEMNTTSKNASQCVCELNPGSTECSKSVVGPADCSANPNLAGCKNVAANCFDTNNISLKCICVRNPESAECKKLLPVNDNSITLNENSFAPVKNALDTRNGNGSEASGMASGKTTEESVGAADKIEKPSAGYAESGVIPPEGASGTTFSSLSNAKAENAGVAAAAGGSSGLSGGGARGSGAVAAITNNTTAASVVNRFGGLLDTAKSAIGGILKKGSGGSDSADYRDGGQSGSGFDAKKFRPRGMVRGLASDEVFAGKHEDIWKVMNKQYKVQDQKDNFIFEDLKK